MPRPPKKPRNKNNKPKHKQKAIEVANSSPIGSVASASPLPNSEKANTTIKAKITSERKFHLKEPRISEGENYNPYKRLFDYDQVCDFFGLDNPYHQFGNHSHPEVIAIINHPCRGCPHLYLAYTPDQYSPTKHKEPTPKFGDVGLNVATPYTASPEEKLGYVMPKPLCLAIPKNSYRNRTNGQMVVDYRETWSRCPLYGVRSIGEVLTQLQEQIDQLKVSR